MKYQIHCTSVMDSNIVKEYPKLRNLLIVENHQDANCKWFKLFLDVNTLEDLNKFMDCIDNNKIVLNRKNSWIEIYDDYRD